MKRFSYCIFTILVLGSAQAGDLDIEGKVERLNSISMESLGISIKALSHLIHASPNGFIPLTYLESSGEIQYVNELEEAGYIKVLTRVGLPDGQEQSETFLNIRPQKKGKEIQRCFQNF